MIFGIRITSFAAVLPQLSPTDQCGANPEDGSVDSNGSAAP